MAGKTGDYDIGIGEKSPEPQRTAEGVGFNKFNGATFDGPAVFAAMDAAFDRALQAFPEEIAQAHFVFGGHHVSMRIVGRDMASHIVRAFAHLKGEKDKTSAPALRIDLWDENKTGIRCYTGSKTISEGWQDVTSISPDGLYIGQLQPSTLSCFNRQTSRILSAVAWSDRIFIYERAKPLSRLLLEWSNDRNIQVVHAGLVAKDGYGILFVAKSGSGKSTASLACLCAGMDYVGEDFIGLEQIQDGSFVGHSLYNSVFLESGHIKRFPELSRHIVKGAAHEEKSVIILSQVFPERLVRTAAIEAIVLPQVTHQAEPTVQKVPRSQALLGMAPSSLIEIPSRGMQGFSKLAALVERVPAYALHLGRNIDSIPIRINEIIAEVKRS